VQQSETGEMSFVDNTVDAKTGTIALKGLFNNANGPRFSQTGIWQVRVKPVFG